MPRKYYPVSSSGAPTQMEIDPTPGSLASQPEQEEKKLEELMAPEEKEQAVIPPVLPQQVEGEQAVTKESEEVVVPPTIENSPKEIP